MRHRTASHWAIIPAAGLGRRMDTDRPKQYLEIAGRTLIELALRHFLDHPRMRGIVVALDPEDAFWPALEIHGANPLITVAGGAQRAHSVLNALDRLVAQAQAHDWALVHDAARPCLTRGDLDRLLAALERDPVGGILASPVHDTIKHAGPRRRSTRTVDREGLWHALTPQMFRLGALRFALRACLETGRQVTDEASAIEHLGLPPRLVHGRADNIKVTRPEDLALARYFLEHQDL
jgi:2-C-methyl-D-erythritol 4-phosphate cytidylyltransferase